MCTSLCCIDLENGYRERMSGVREQPTWGHPECDFQLRRPFWLLMSCFGFHSCHGMFVRFERRPYFRVLLRLGKSSLLKMSTFRSVFTASEDFIASEDTIASEPIPSHHISATPLYPKQSHSSAIHPSGAIQSIRRHPKSVIRSPIHVQLFTDSGASIFGTSQLSLNQKISVTSQKLQ